MKKLIDINLLKSFFNHIKDYHFNDDYKHVPTVGLSMKSVLSVNNLGKPEWVNFDEMWHRDSSFEEQYIKENSYGVTFKYSDLSGIKRIGSEKLHKECPIQNNLRGCIEQNGKIQYYLHPDNWNYKSDGITPSRLDGYDGNVSIDTYRDFFINFSRTGDDCFVRISQQNLGNEWIKVPRLLIHAFMSSCLNTVPENMGWLSTLQQNSMVSVVNNAEYVRGGDKNKNYDSKGIFASTLNKPTTAITRTTARQYFRLNGYENLNFYQYMYIFYWLYVIEYCSFNSQEDITDDSLTGFKQGGLGASITTLTSAQWGSFNDYRPLCPNGYFKDCGNHTAFKTFEIDTNGSKITLQTHSWHGFQNIFGDIFMNLDGVTIIKKQENGVWKTIWELIKNPQNYTDSESAKSDTVKIEIAGVNSLWPIQMYFGNEGLIIPIKGGGSSGSGTCDYFYNSKTTPACLLVCGNADHGYQAGSCYLDANPGVNFAHPTVGYRGVISPKI